MKGVVSGLTAVVFGCFWPGVLSFEWIVWPNFCTDGLHRNYAEFMRGRHLLKLYWWPWDPYTTMDLTSFVEDLYHGGFLSEKQQVSEILKFSNKMETDTIKAYRM